MSPDVSVIIPAFNRAHCIASAIFSAAAQAVVSTEIIVVDDASTDRTASIVEKLSRPVPNLRLVRHRDNRGASAARNTGIDAARGDYIAFLDSDDEWSAEKLASQLAELEMSDTDPARTVSLTYIAYRHAGEKNLRIDQRFVAQDDVAADWNGEVRTYTPQEAKARILALDLPVYPASTLMARRDAVGRFDETLAYGEDSEYLIRHIVAGGEVTVLPDFLAVYRVPERTRTYRDEGRFAPLMLARYADPIRERFGEAAGAHFKRRIRQHAAKREAFRTTAAAEARAVP